MSFEIDRTSLLVFVPGAATLNAIENALSGEDLTLGVTTSDVTVADWLSSGAPGAPSAFLDPADHLVAGLSATMTNGRQITIRPSPRRAVGPDLAALFLGANDRFGTIDRVWLRVHLKNASAARRVALPLAPSIDLDPPISAEESTLLDAIARALATTTD